MRAIDADITREKTNLEVIREWVDSQTTVDAIPIQAVKDAREEIWSMVDKAISINRLHYIPIVDAVEIIQRHTKVGDAE